MTVEEFEETKSTLSCRMCGHVGLVAVENPNNGGIRPGCPSCGLSTPIAGIQFLKKRSASSRKVRRPSGDPSTEEVWAVNGNTCAFCGKTKQECERFEIGLTMQHVVPYVDGGENGPLIPFCSRCQQASVAAFAETKRIRHYCSTLEEQIARIRALSEQP